MPQPKPGEERQIKIGQIGTVFVPVRDQDRALEFYVNTLGFEKVYDFQYGDGWRWVEVAPPGSNHRIALVPPQEGSSIQGNATYCAVETPDIEGDHANLRERGVDVDPVIAREGTSRQGLFSLEASVSNPVPAQFFFRDPDGNRFLVVQP